MTNPRKKFRNFHAFLPIFFKVLAIPAGNSALHSAVRTFIHIAVALAHAPTAAKKESLLLKMLVSKPPHLLQMMFRDIMPGNFATAAPSALTPLSASSEPDIFGAGKPK